jgi:hypothetical protein
MAAMSLRAGLLLSLLLVVALTAPAAVSAHVPAEPLSVPVEAHPPASTRSADTPIPVELRAVPWPPASPWLGVAALALGVAAVALGRRRALVLAAVAVLAVVAFETGVHSVHHLDDHTAGASCVVSSVGGQVTGTPVAGVVVEIAALPARDEALPAPATKVVSLSGAAHRGRAPPLAA